MQHISFGGACGVIALALLCSLSGDRIPVGAVVLMAVTAAVYAAFLVLVALRKKARAGKGRAMFWLDLGRDFLMSGLAVLAVAVLLGTPVYETSISVRIAIFEAGEKMISALADLIVCIFRVVVLLTALSALKKTAKFYPGNSAGRKDVNDILNRKYVVLLVLSLVFWLVGSVLDTCLVGDSERIFAFDASMVTTWLNLFVTNYLPAVLVAIGGIVLANYVGGAERKGAAPRVD